ncbi:hypothetical protein FB451DRAFT_1172021 [Mycena latifolia]|nr:hypothetical protein FB451DRAFT_1172021 [Mycena latifolia]
MGVLPASERRVRPPFGYRGAAAALWRKPFGIAPRGCVLLPKSPARTPPQRRAAPHAARAGPPANSQAVCACGLRRGADSASSRVQRPLETNPSYVDSTSGERDDALVVRHLVLPAGFPGLSTLPHSVPARPRGAARRREPAGIKNKKFKRQQVWVAVKDSKIWILFSCLFAVAIPNGVVSNFSSMIIKDMGFSTSKTVLKSVSAITQIVALIVGGVITLNVKNTRLIASTAVNIICVVAAACMAHLPRRMVWSRFVSFWLVTCQSVEAVSVIAHGPLRAEPLHLPKLIVNQRRSVDEVLLALYVPLRRGGGLAQRHEFLKRASYSCFRRATVATYGTQVGWVHLPTQKNMTPDMAKFEICGHKYADLSESSYGVAPLSESKYGFACQGNILRISFVPSCYNGARCRRLRLESTPLLPAPPQALLNTTHSPFTLNGAPNVLLKTIKRGEDDSFKPGRRTTIVLRLYEALGGHGQAQLRVMHGL